MGMSNYNRQNPFMYLLESKQDELTNKTTNGMKHMIEMYFISICAILLNIFFSYVYSSHLWVITPIILYLNITTFLEIKQCVKAIRSGDINEMIFGDTYKDINVNNEMILSMINDYNVAIGKVIHLIDNIFMMKILYEIIIAIYVVLGMISIFK